MLAITPAAAAAIHGLVSSAGMPDEAGLRISPMAGEGRPGFELSLSPVPAGDDAVVDEHGAHVFLEPHAVSALEDTVLDAEVEGGQVRFALRASEAG